MLNRPLQFVCGPAPGFQPTVLHQAPHDLNAIELRAVGLQELELEALPLQQLKCWLDGCSAVDAGVVEHDHQWLADLQGQVIDESQEQLGGAAAPVVGDSTVPLLSSAAMTLRRLPRGASMRCCSPRSVQALRLGCTCAKPASSR